MLFGNETVGRVGSSRKPCPPIEGSTYSSWPWAITATQKEPASSNRAREFFIIIFRQWFQWFEWELISQMEFRRATFFQRGRSTTGSDRSAGLHSRTT